MNAHIYDCPFTKLRGHRNPSLSYVHRCIDFRTVLSSCFIGSKVEKCDNDQKRPQCSKKLFLTKLGNLHMFPSLYLTLHPWFHKISFSILEKIPLNFISAYNADADPEILGWLFLQRQHNHSAVLN